MSICSDPACIFPIGEKAAALKKILNMVWPSLSNACYNIKLVILLYAMRFIAFFFPLNYYKSALLVLSGLFLLFFLLVWIASSVIN